MSLLIKQLLCILKVVLKLRYFLSAKMFPEIFGLSNCEWIEAHEVSLPVLEEVILLITSELFIELTILTRLVCPIFCLSFLSSLLIRLRSMSLLLERVPIIVLVGSPIAEVLANVLVCHFLVGFLVMWLLSILFIMS